MAKMICGNCGLLGEPTKHRQGGKALALGLLVSPLFLAGVKWYMGCPACGAPNMISLDSPRGQELLPAARANAERLGARKGTLQPTDELYYSEGWWIRPLNGPVLGPFSTREEAERAERGAAPQAKAEQLRVEAGAERKCPWCAELVKREAKVCRFCGKDLPEPEPFPGVPKFKTREEYETWKARRQKP